MGLGLQEQCCVECAYSDKIQDVLGFAQYPYSVRV